MSDECHCFACKSWHEDGGEGRSMFCDGAEPVVVERGPNWEPPVISDSKDQVSREAYDRSAPVPSSFAVTFGLGSGYWANQENGQCTDLDPPAGWDQVEPVIVEGLEP
jgi:hypothetical protein